MFRNTPLANTPTFKLVLGFGLCTLGGAMLYAYFRIRDEEEEAEEEQKDALQNPKNTKKNNKQQTRRRPAGKEVTVQLVMANKYVPLVAGRYGANLKSIENKTQTKIHFRDKDEEHKYCDITGFPDDVKEARALLLREIERSPIVKEELQVPASVCGKIIGRCGEMLQEICRLSLAKVTVDSGEPHSDCRRIVIIGNRQQVNIARKLIEDRIDEDENLRRAVEEVGQKREPRRSPTNSRSSSRYSSQTSLSLHLPPQEKLLAARADEKPMEVYVSAIASPSKFWVQLIGPQTKKLDDMVTAMTDYYSVPENRALHEISEPYVGQIVATVFKHDNKWYRAEIVGILPNQYNPNEVVLDLYFVDYGDSEYVLPHEIFELRTDFLTLRFQAVECFLANVKSTLSSDPDTWEHQSIEFFEEFTQVARWKKLISRVVTYKERSSTAKGGATAPNQSSQIPGVELFDTCEGVEVNLGHMMILNGFALASTDEYPHVRPPFSQQSRSNSNDDATMDPTLQSLTPDLGLVDSNRDTADELIEQQLQHLQKNNNLYLNENSMKKPSSVEFLNGNVGHTTSTASPETPNGNVSR